MLLHQCLAPIGVGSTDAKDLQASPTPNASVLVNYQCIDVFFCTVGLTGASIISSLDCHVISSLHRRLPSYSVGSTGATDLPTVAILQCTAQLILDAVGSTDTCIHAEHFHYNLDILTVIWTPSMD
jgi:hypothetical protein